LPRAPRPARWRPIGRGATSRPPGGGPPCSRVGPALFATGPSRVSKGHRGSASALEEGPRGGGYQPEPYIPALGPAAIHTGTIQKKEARSGRTGRLAPRTHRFGRHGIPGGLGRNAHRRDCGAPPFLGSFGGPAPARGVSSAMRNAFPSAPAAAPAGLLRSRWGRPVAERKGRGKDLWYEFSASTGLWLGGSDKQVGNKEGKVELSLVTPPPRKAGRRPGGAVVDAGGPQPGERRRTDPAP